MQIQSPWAVEACPQHFFLYEKAAFKSTSAEPLPRWVIGTGQLNCLQFRSGPIARRGRGGMMPFLSFVVGRTGSEYSRSTRGSDINYSTFGVRLSWWGQACVIDAFVAIYLMREAVVKSTITQA